MISVRSCSYLPGSHQDPQNQKFLSIDICSGGLDYSASTSLVGINFVRRSFGAMVPSKFDHFPAAEIVSVGYAAGVIVTLSYPDSSAYVDACSILALVTSLLQSRPSTRGLPHITLLSDVDVVHVHMALRVPYITKYL